MLPKFASHVLHHTQRAAATAQNYAFRNVLGLQNPSSSPGSLNGWTNTGSSSWGGYGTGAGGAKFNTGSRFYSGYSNAGRAVTQGNSSTAHDSTTGRTDEEDDLRLNRTALVIKSRPRPRSSSLSLSGSGRKERAETFGVLETVQLHQARAHHVLTKVVASDDLLLEYRESSDVVEDPSSRPVLVRRNSTAASSTSDLESTESLEPPPRPVSPQPIGSAESLSTDPSLPQSLSPPSSAFEDASDNAGEPADFSVYQRLEDAMRSRDPARITAEVLNFRTSHPNPNVREYNMALQALLVARAAGQPITVILETYNEMLTRQIAPNVRTYKTIILALCERDKEVNKVILQLQSRMKRRELRGQSDSIAQSSDVNQLARLRKEDNFGSALLIFEAGQSLFRDRDNRNLSLGAPVYSALLHSCAIHGNVNAAVRVWSQIESASGFLPDPICFYNLLSTYVSVGDLGSAQDVFNEFRLASQEGRISWVVEGEIDDLSTHIISDDARTGKARGGQMLIWIKMVEAYFRAKQPVKAISLLEEMMDTKATVNFGSADVPPPCTAVYSAFITGFIQNNDITSALSWFDRMLKQDYVAAHILEPTLRTPRPEQGAWNAILEALFERKMVTEANRIFHAFLEHADRDGLKLRKLDVCSMFEINVEYLAKHPSLPTEEFDQITSFLEKIIWDLPNAEDWLPLVLIENQRPTFSTFINILASHKKFDKALGLLEQHVLGGLRYINNNERTGDIHPQAVLSRRKQLRNVISEVAPAMLMREGLKGPDATISIDFAFRFGALSEALLCANALLYNAVYMRAFYAARERGELQSLDRFQWAFFANAASGMILQGKGEDTKIALKDIPDRYKFKGLPDFMRELQKAGIEPQSFVPKASRKLGMAVWHHFGGKEESLKFFASLGPEWAAYGEDLTRYLKGKNSPDILTDTNNEQQVRLDKYHSRSVDEYFPAHPTVTPQMAWARYEGGAANNVFPLPDVIGRMISTFGRLNDMDKVYRLYQDGQNVLKVLANNKEHQSAAWYTLEDQMIIALAHATYLDKAHVHRQRIIDQGGSPSADAYGALIQCVKETTDDSANALELWQESQYRGVTPNLYLYNTIISKLSKARKADLALDLFQQMKANFVRPSSVTYGAIIAACCRVGDAQSAEILFEEMTSQKNFKPRIPPFNTMIQFYTHIVRDRERALHYFSALLSAGIKPSAHTYKLLIDCYGTIEPVDIASMDDVFSKLLTDRRVQVQGVHWAALINTWGCVQKDLGKATGIFDSIASHPTTQRSNSNLPDAVVYESMINVLVTLRRTDLIPSYLDRLTQSGVHMTAYIANLLIKGFAAAGDLERARQVFENLADPPTGMAAPNNHAPHEMRSQSSVPPDAPVYREPSTWEAMVRAELGSGNRDNAVALLDRVQERRFPPAVLQRIKGIMLDESVSPWTTSSESETHSP